MSLLPFLIPENILQYFFIPQIKKLLLFDNEDLNLCNFFKINNAY
jgi:hypothetical protein